MGRRLVFVLLAVLAADLTMAQTVTNVNVRQVDKDILITYSLDIPAETSVYYSTNGGKTFSGPLVHVVGDVGVLAHSGRNECRWLVLQEISSLTSDNVVFKVVPKSVKGRLVVKSKPGNATVSLGAYYSSYAGTTPLETELAEGYHTVTVSKKGYQPYNERVTILPGQTRHVTAKLKRSASSAGGQGKLSQFWDTKGFNLGCGLVGGYDDYLGVYGGAGIYWRLFRHNSLFNINLGVEYAYYSLGGSVVQFPMLLNWNCMSFFNDNVGVAIGAGVMPIVCQDFSYVPFLMQMTVGLRHFDFKLGCSLDVSDTETTEAQVSLGVAYYF